MQRGREVHEARETKPIGARRIRQGGVVIAVDTLLEGQVIGLKGKVDEILELGDGALAPIDFKFTEKRDSTFQTHQVQLCMYALLIEEVMERPVQRGWVVYVRAGNQFHEIVFDDKLRARTATAIRETRSIISETRFPFATRNRKKCPDCTYRKICPDGP